VDFKDARDRLLTQELNSANSALSDAIATFAFSHLPKQNRIALILAGIFGGEAEQYLAQAAEIEFYASKNFAVPYAPKTEAVL